MRSFPYSIFCILAFGIAATTALAPVGQHQLNRLLVSPPPLSFRAVRPVSDLPAKFDDDYDATVESFDPLHLMTAEPDAHTRATLVGVISLIAVPGVASAAAPDALPSAFAAYAHYLSILAVTASIMTERLTVKPAMSIEEEKLLGTADIFTGIWGVVLLISGYYRATAYGKGWDFYSHEPLFWLKMTLLGIFGALSLFPTITIIQRTVKIQQQGTIEPMSEELANRMKKVLNAELTALASIPLTATLMTRGVGYINDFPTQIVGPFLFGLITAGACYKYVKDAITWKEETIVLEG